MNALTLGTTKAAIARAVGLCSTDSRVTDLINESQQRLIFKGDWQGVFMRYRICVNESCLVWPRQIDEIEAVAICKTPGKVRNAWFEFNGVGPGLSDEDNDIGRQLIDRGSTVAFDWVRTNGNYIRVYAMNAADVGKTIVLKFYDDSAQKVYSTIDGTVQEGEEVTLVAPPNYAVTSNAVDQQGLYGVVKDETDYPVLLYEFDGADNVRQLAHYEPNETHPIYRCSMIPGIQNMSACEGSDDDCDDKTVNVMARLRHIPVVVDNDPLVLQNVGALKLMAMAIWKEEQGDQQEAQVLEAKALTELEFELRAHLGQGPVVALRTEDPELYGGGGVSSLVSTGGYYY